MYAAMLSVKRCRPCREGQPVGTRQRKIGPKLTIPREDRTRLQFSPLALADWLRRLT